MAVGRDQNEPVALIVDIADLAGGFRAEKIEIGLAQDVHAVFRTHIMEVGWAILIGDLYHSWARMRVIGTLFPQPG
jgi:hypothetical protein